MLEKTSPQELSDFFSYVVGVMEHLQIPYMVVGGFAAIFYGEPRLTIDVDIIADIKVKHVKTFIAAFPLPKYYLSEEDIYDSLRRRYPFNIIQSTTGAKVDIVPLPDDPFTRVSFSRRQRMVYNEAGQKAEFISAEDIVLAKLFAFEQTGSEKHLRDARGVLVVQWGQLDLALMRRIADRSGVLVQFEQIYEAARREIEG
ncbi:MAG: hypothetical protein AB1801_05155 [Chloroflexota bacterium]